jgi:hypothetical protein
MLPSTLNMEARLTGDDPDGQVADTINLMSEYVRADAHSPEVIKEAIAIAPIGSDPSDVVDGVFWYVKRLIQFQHDEVTAAPLTSRLAQAGLSDIPVIEVLIRPRDMVTWREDTGRGQVGDCDDYAMLTAALLRAHRIPASFVTAAADPRLPGQYSHVYVAAYPPSGRIALDTSHGAFPGWEVENASRKEEWPVDAGLGILIMAGFIGLAYVAKALMSWFGRRRRMS